MSQILPWSQNCDQSSMSQISQVSRIVFVCHWCCHCRHWCCHCHCRLSGGVSSALWTMAQRSRVSKFLICFLLQLLAGMPPWSDFHGWLDGWMRSVHALWSMGWQVFFTIYTCHVHVISRLCNVTFKKSYSPCYESVFNLAQRISGSKPMRKQHLNRKENKTVGKF